MVCEQAFSFTVPTQVQCCFTSTETIRTPHPSGLPLLYRQIRISSLPLGMRKRLWSEQPALLWPTLTASCEVTDVRCDTTEGQNSMTRISFRVDGQLMSSPCLLNLQRLGSQPLSVRAYLYCFQSTFIPRCGSLCFISDWMLSVSYTHLTLPTKIGV